jgi:hypothetical protein
MRSRHLGLACLLAGAPGCRSAHEQTPPIHVAPAAAARWANWVERGPPPDARPARVRVMKDGDTLGGSNAIGRPGDLLLENDEVVFVIDQLGSSAGFAESGGNIVDAADARLRKDELGQIFTYFGTFPRQGVYEALSSGVAGDGSAWVQASGHELSEPALSVTTRYSLRPGDRGLLLETSVRNRGPNEITLPSLGDAVQWGAAEKFAPGKPHGFKGDSTGPFVGGLGRFTSYAMAPVEGDLAATSGAGWTDTVQRVSQRMRPDAEVSYARVFFVGDRPDTSSLAAALAMGAGEEVGPIHVHVLPADSLPTGALLTLASDRWPDGLTLAGPFAGRVPAGRYHLTPSIGGAVLDAPALFEVRPGSAPTELAVRAQPAASLDVHCVDGEGAPLPCKVTFEGRGGTITPDFGAAHAAGPARNQATTSDGTSRVRLAAGKYRVTASRGPEYGLASIERSLDPGEHRDEVLSLSRIVDTRGYVACDFHQHTMIGTDAPVGVRDRVVANTAEAVEVAVASEHNVIADLEAVVRELHLERYLVEISGVELTSDASRHPWGHANVFPLVADATKPAGGAPIVRDHTPGELFAALRAGGSGVSDASVARIVQVNHPRSGRNGYFDLLGFDRSIGRGTDAAYDPGFDAIEVWNGRNVEARGSVLDDLRALLRTGHPVTATANTDTHGIVGQEAGYPRTYVRVADDAHLDALDQGRSADLVRGVKDLRDVVLTNGPMLRVTANGKPIGAIVRGPEVTLKVHVECAPWVDVDTVRWVRAREGVGPAGAEQPVRLTPLPSGARAADVTLSLRVDGDDAVFVVVSGARPLTPVLGGGAEGDVHGILPWAMTGAFWVDADGDGAALAR